MSVSPILIRAALAAALLGAPSALAQEKVEWHWSVHGNPRAFTVGMEKLAEIAKEKSGGNFNVKIAYGETISPAKEVLDSIKIGAIEGGITCASYAPGKTPLLGVLDLPFLPFENINVQRHVHEAVYRHPAVVKEVQRWNALPFFSALLPQYEFMGTGDPPRKLDQWKGMRVRALAGLGEAMKQLGAVPTTVPAPEVYTSLERGVVQAASFPFTYAHAAYRLPEVSKWYTMGLSPGTVNCPLTLSQQAFQKLPEAYRKILEDAKPAAYDAMVKAYKEADEANLPAFEKIGLTRIGYTAEQRQEFEDRAAKPVWDAWVKEMESKRLPGRELLDFVLSEAKKAASS